MTQRLVDCVDQPTEPLDPEGSLPQRLEHNIRTMGQAPGRLTLASIVRAREAFGAALVGNRPLGREDRTVLGLASTALIVVTVLAALVPTVVGWIVVAFAGWMGLTTGVRAFLQARRARMADRAAMKKMASTTEEGRT